MQKLLAVLCLFVVSVPAVEAAKQKPPKGPTPKLVKKSLRSVMHAGHKESWMTNDQVKITIKKLKIGKAERRKTGPNQFDPKIWAWPVKADVTIKVCRAPGECEITRTGWYTKDEYGRRTIFWFDRNTASRAWHWSAGTT